MLALESEVEFCSQCGAPLSLSVDAPGCLQCLLTGGLEKTRQRFQHYEVELCEDGQTLCELGRGAMGVTYRALDSNLGSYVALKIIGAPYSHQAEARRRFQREARAAAKLRHPNVASVFHYGETPTGQCFYAMELVEGETLQERLRRDGSLGGEETLEIASQVARALVAAEKHGLVHCDLKPSNLMLLPNDQSSARGLWVKVIDFGLARLASERSGAGGASQSGLSGTPGFASPEQLGASGAPVDVRSDIYSLGATLAYALCGQTPEDLPCISRCLHEAKVPSALIALLQRMLAPLPNDRPQSARELLGAIEKCQRQVVFARQRPRWLATATVFLLFALAAGFGLMRFRAHLHRATQEKSIAVLPFQNLSSQKENAYFASGVQEEILSDLARVADLRVISRSSVMQYGDGASRNLREIARALGVANIVEGSVQRDGQRVRVIAQLIDARRDSHLWTETYDRSLSDTFDLEDEVAEEIARQLEAKISPQERALMKEKPTSDLTAYSLYNQSLPLRVWRREEHDNKIKLLEEAIERDSNFILAYCALAEIYDRDYLDCVIDQFGAGSAEKAAKAKAMVDAALKRRPDRGEPRLALANHLFLTGQYEQARPELDMALRLLPNNAAALFLDGRLHRRFNHFDGAIEKARRAFALDPHHYYYVHWVGDACFMSRRYREGEDFIQEAITKNPTAEVQFNGILVKLKIAEGDLAGARNLKVDTTLPEGPEFPFKARYWARDYQAALDFVNKEEPASSDAGEVLDALGQHKEAAEIFRVGREGLDAKSRRGARNEWYYLSAASLDARLGKKDEAIREARQALDLHPIATDTVNGPNMALNLAEVYAMTGEKEMAIDELELLAKIPSQFSYGNASYNPIWDSLRGEPRFKKLIAQLRPSSVR